MYAGGDAKQAIEFAWPYPRSQAPACVVKTGKSDVKMPTTTSLWLIFTMALLLGC